MLVLQKVWSKESPLWPLKILTLALFVILVGSVACTPQKSSKTTTGGGEANQATTQTVAGVKGTFHYVLNSEPQNLNPINIPDLYARRVLLFTHEGLLNTNLDTNELEPGLAERWEESKDGKNGHVLSSQGRSIS